MDRSSETQILRHELPRRLSSLGQVLPLDHRHAAEVQAVAAGSFPKVWSEEDFRFFLSHEQKLCFGLFTEGEPGILRLRSYFIALLVAGDVDIISIATRPLDRRLGLSERLLDHVCHAPTVRRAFLEVEVGNEAAIGLYEKYGFKRLGTRPAYYGPGRDAYLMCWERFS